MNNPKTPVQQALAFIVILLAGAFLVYEFVLQIIPSVISTELMRDFHVDALTFASMSSAYYPTYAAMQLLAGLCFDRLGARITLTAACLLCAIGTAFIATTQEIQMVVVGRLFTGVGSACAYVGVLFLGKRWFHAKHFYAIVGATQLLGCLGAVFGELPTAAVVDLIGWRATLDYLAVIGFALSILILMIIRNQPKTTDNQQFEPAIEKNILANLIKVMKTSQAWAVGCYAFMIFVPMAIFALMWGPAFLQAKYQASTKVATSMVTIVWLSNGIFSWLAGWLSERMKSRCIPLASCAFFGIFISLIMIYAPVSKITMSFLLLCFGIACAGQSLSFNVVNDITPINRIGVAMGFNNMLIVTTSGIFQPITGGILDMTWDGTVKNGVNVYSVANFQEALLIIPVAFLAAFLIAKYWMTETYCQNMTAQEDLAYQGHQAAGEATALT